MCVDCTLLEEGLDASDELVAVLKAAKPPGILTAAGLVLATRELYLALRRATSDEEKAALLAIIAMIDRDWTRTTAAGRNRIYSRVQRRITDLGEATDKATQPVFERQGRKMLSKTRAAQIKRHRFKIPSPLSDKNERMLRFIKESQSNYVTDEFKRRGILASKKMRTLVERGMKEKMFRDPMTRMLTKEMDALVAGRSKHYFDVVSRIYVNRGRTLGSLANYDEAGIERYEFVATMDFRTSEICRFMHGKSWPVKAELDRFDEAERLREPEAIKDLMPFVQSGSDADGRPILYYKRGDQRHKVADVVEPGTGRRGLRGRYDMSLTDAQLQARGIAVPPLHGNCRSTIVPVIGAPTPTVTAMEIPTWGQLGRMPDYSQTLRLRTNQLPPLGRVLDIDGKPIAATSEARLDSIRSVFRRGQKAVDDTFGRGIVLGVRRDGKFDIVDGRHRLIAAREFPQIEVLARFEQVFAGD